MLIINDNIFYRQQIQDLKFSSAPTDVNIVKWGSTEGFARLENAKFKNDFYQLINFYQPQINPLYCSAASSVIILNAINTPNNKAPSQKNLEVARPKSLGGEVIEFKSFSQTSFFNEKTDKIKKREIIDFKKPKSVQNGKEIYDPGLSLKEMTRILQEVYDLNVTLTYVNDKASISKFRSVLKKVLNENKKFLVVNFDGKKLGLGTRGHISPIAAFDEESDSVLVLDVALHKNSWYFVSVEDLFRAMNTKDGDNFRGYLVISK